MGGLVSDRLMVTFERPYSWAFCHEQVEGRGWGTQALPGVLVVWLSISSVTPLTFDTCNVHTQ